MKIHITNVYNFNIDDNNVKKQHAFANAARSLGFLEMGIFNYPVDTDTERELSTRLDGVIAGLEYGDIVFMQLPTGNGFLYEQSLINKIKSYNNTKLVLVFHDMEYFLGLADMDLQVEYISLYKKADFIVAPSSEYSNMLKGYEITNVLYCDNINVAYSVSREASSSVGNNYLSLCQSDFYIQKMYMDVIEKLFSQESTQYKLLNMTFDDEIHIGFGLHDKTGDYSIWVGVAMQSIIEHTQSKICFHILHDDTLNKENRNKLMIVANSGGHRILFHYLDKNDFIHLSEQMKNYTIGAMFRVMLPELLEDLSKIIYLDADLLVNRNIQELWEIDIDDYCLAAVPDIEVVKGSVVPIPVRRGEVSAFCYFNSGVLYMNLNRIRAKGRMYEKIMTYLADTVSSDLPDQDALNAIYTNETFLLDGSWNHFAKDVHVKGERQLLPKIYHYVGTRPTYYCFTGMDELYFETMSRTPWGIEACQKHFRKAIERTTDRISQLEKLIYEIIAHNKKIIYYGEENFPIRNMYKMLTIRNGDYRVLSEPKDGKECILPCRSISVLSEEKDSYVVLVLPDADEGKAIGNLEKMGLKEGIDFFNIRRILWVFDGGYL